MQFQKVSALIFLPPPPKLVLALGLYGSYCTRGKHHFTKNGEWWKMQWLPIKWMSFGVYMADELSALHQCSGLPGFFKGPWEAFAANEGTLARSCVTPCHAQHSCSSCHFLPLTTWLWLWTASTFCIFIFPKWVMLKCLSLWGLLLRAVDLHRSEGFLLCVVMCCFMALFYFLFHPPPTLSSTWFIKLNLT